MGLSEAEIETIARRVVELLGAERGAQAHPARMVDAATLAGELGVERDWIYAHAERLGAIRLGGPNGRLRFDREMAIERLAVSNAEEQPASKLSRQPRRPARRRKGRAPGNRVRNAEVKSPQIQRRASDSAPARSPKQRQTGGNPE
jgi:hypothetical protein